ncbi:tetratricopeptide repeat protein [Filimonas effusa]|uniref:Tetratricopeptide repeat protein n=1 Tax=Filimonas effusa TaxID=2508721 RepID=A0A4Q1DCC5_9BACT|nr:tetratricopeptide repeat protein [Filimonas effusa]RXK87164.1 tetratricopeptide repeat protein [Filimonas effusa]
MDRIERIHQLLEKTPKDNFLRHALALEYMKVGREQEARGLFENILSEFPDYVGSYYHLGKLLERMGQPALALEWYTKGMAAARLAGDKHAYGELQAAYEDVDE